MSTSGSSDFTETRDQLISGALSLLGVLAAGETAQSADITYCATVLNAMVKAWMAQGIHLWTEESGTIFLVNGQPQYNLQAGASGSKASDGSNTVETTLAAAVSSGTSISVASTTFNQATMQIGDTIGVSQDNNVILWTTIANIVGTTITLNASVASSASAGNGVYSYTTQLPRVLSIQSARYRNPQNFDRVIDIKPREDYMRIPQKELTGSPIILYYSPQLTNGQVFVWPAPNTTNGTIEITYLRTIQDFDTGSDNPDFPQEWLEAITYNLAVRIAPAYGISLSSGGINGNPDILRQAAQYLEDMKAWDTEIPYVQIVRKPTDYNK